MQQTITGLGFDGNMNYNRNRNHTNEEAHGHPGEDRGPEPRRRHPAFKELSSEEEDYHFKEEVDGRKRQENPHSFRVKIDLPCFNGHLHVENFLDWILEVENFFNYMQTPDT